MKGFSTIETLLATLLSGLIMTATLHSQWFARRTLLVSLEQMAAVQMLIDVSHTADFSPYAQGSAMSPVTLPCTACTAAASSQLGHALNLLSQPHLAALIDPVLCAESGHQGIRLILSWSSAVPLSPDLQSACGSGDNRRQVMLEAE